MQFSVITTEKNGILQTCERQTRLGLGTITGDTVNLSEFTNYVNEANRELWSIIYRSSGGWQYEDSNQSDLPFASGTLTSGQTTYSLPTGTVGIRGIEVKDSNNVWHKLSPITDEEIRTRSSVGNFLSSPGTPLYYQLVGNTVKIFPASSWTQTLSFKVFYDRGSVDFETTDTTKEPGFEPQFHDLVPLRASLIWFEINSPEDLTYQILVRKYESRKKDLEQFYSAKSGRTFKQRLRTYFENTR